MEITNYFEHKILPSLQKKIEKIEKHYEGNERSRLIQAYISRGGYLVIDSERNRKSADKYYMREFFGPRGGLSETRYYKEYDFTDNEPYVLLNTIHH